ARRRALSQSEPAWVVSYSSQSSPGEVHFVVDALTGEVIIVSGARTAVRTELETANQAGVAWQPDAELVFVGSFGPVNSDGRSDGWAFAYYSPALNELHTVFVSGGIVFDERPASPDDVPSTLPLPTYWADSDVAAAAAEAASGGFRDQYPEAEVFARLSRGFPGVSQDRILWEFTFHPAPQGEILLRILVDGLTGAVTTSTEPPGLPGSVSLLEAYPNPSTGPTSIRYGLEATGTVELTVMNALGQVVRSILSDRLPAGEHSAQWDGLDDSGTPVASGSYWLRLQSDRGVRSVSVVVIRR
ncbi:MAG TPA: FlgD immunoglobulin-like domain containing protein, partial [Rhodothermales bacterium]|nr:FlgD immunoglobulin-like domain containing protein [Rhodothermales bacterium]